MGMQGTLDFSYWPLHYCGKTYHDDLILGSHAKGRGVTLQRQSHSLQVPVFASQITEFASSSYFDVVTTMPNNRINLNFIAIKEDRPIQILKRGFHYIYGKLKL